jgi:hypothetical protein
MQDHELVPARIVAALAIAAAGCVCLGLRFWFQDTPVTFTDAQPQASQEQSKGDQGTKRHIQAISDFSRLSAPSRHTLGLILLIPVGTLVTAAIQRLGGLRTIGTFGPTLLALGQTKSDWHIGLLVFMATFGIGLFFRMMFSPLKLPAISRRVIVLVFVVLFLSVAISLCEFLGLDVNPRSIVLPVVVTTMMIERFFIILGKDGTRVAADAFCNSLIVAVVCFLLFSFTLIAAVLLALPESELLIISGSILIGCYSGPTLVGILGLRKSPSAETEE